MIKSIIKLSFPFISVIVNPIKISFAEKCPKIVISSADSANCCDSTTSTNDPQQNQTKVPKGEKNGDKYKRRRLYKTAREGKNGSEIKVRWA